MDALQFKAAITQIDKYAEDSLADNMLILFYSSASEDVTDYCFIHDQGRAVGTITTISSQGGGESQ